MDDKRLDKRKRMAEDRCQLIRRGDCRREARDQAPQYEEDWGVFLWRAPGRGCCDRAAGVPSDWAVPCTTPQCRQQRGRRDLGETSAGQSGLVALPHRATNRQRAPSSKVSERPATVPETEVESRIEGVVHLLIDILAIRGYTVEKMKSPCHYPKAADLGPCDVSSSSARAWKRV